MLARYRDARVVPLEVWDLLVEGVPLYRIARDRDFGGVLGRAAEALASGMATSESGARFPDACRSIRRVVLVGGAAEDIVWCNASLPAERALDPEHCAEQGGRAILAGQRGLVVDLGQSRLKIASAARRRVYARDFDAIPASLRPIDGTGRAALLAFVAGALREAVAWDPPEALVLALPCEVSDDGVIGTCSYPWQSGDGIVGEILEAAGLAGLTTWVLNDAELAALGVVAHGAREAGTLVLTLGFGVGGALLGDRG